MKNTNTVETITKSETKKAIRYFEKKHPGSSVIASGWATHPQTEDDKVTGFQTVSVELWSEEERESYTVYLAVCLWDRRKTFVMKDAENWYTEPTKEETTTDNNNNEEENTMKTNTTNTLKNTTDFEIEIQRSNITPAQFLAYVRSRVDAKGGHWYRSDLDLAWFKNADERWNSEYSFGLPGDRGAASELSRDKAYDKQTYVMNFDGSVYNEIVEFDFDDEKTGHGYYYLLNKSAAPEDEENNKRYLIEQAKAHLEREIEHDKRVIAQKKADLERTREYNSRFWIEMEERDIRSYEIGIENYLDDIKYANELLGIVEPEAEKEEKSMNEVKFEIGSKHESAGLYGGHFTYEVISRTESTVTFRESWISEDTGKLCHAEPIVHAIEVEKIGGVTVERVEMWEYRGSKGYLYAATEEERDMFYEAAKESETAEKLEGQKLYDRVYQMLFDCAEDEKTWGLDYDKIMNAIGDTLDLDEDTFGKVYDDFHSEFDLYVECHDCESTEEKPGEAVTEEAEQEATAEVEYTETDEARAWKMENIRIESQGNFCFVGGRKVEYFNVIADSERFGKNEIMCQGTWADCLRYLEARGIDYLRECLKRNRKTDIQVSFRMYKITGETGDGLELRSRDGFDRFLKFSDMKPIAPNTFKIPRDLFGSNAATVKLMNARAW